jgi:hypothetical protein
VLSEGVFPLIPSVYVDNSLLTAVLLGVLLLFFLGELFGWPQSGLVVPGYLAGILVVAPEVALVIGVEALLTYLLARAVIWGLPRLLPMDRAFGRDRFFLILVLSILVRIWMEAGPGAGWLGPLHIGSAAPLHSVGLVLVPLTANALWMPGLFRGLPLVVLPVLVVFVLLDQVLLPFTNLNLSHFAFTVEAISQDFLATPRSYILLLVGCAIATRMNLRFGWEFGGILVPGLLAIAWMSPAKVLATLVEVGAMVLVLRILLQLRPFRRANLSGLRPLVLAFVLAYVLKLLLAWWLGESYPGFRAHELFGFGYLLPSLLVVRCWKRGSIGRILLPTTLASLGGFFVGSALANALEWTHTEDPPSLNQATAQRQRPAWEAMVQGPVALHAVNPEQAALLSQAVESAFSGQAVFGHGLRVDSHPDGILLHGGERLAVGRLWLRPKADSPFALVLPGAGGHAGLPEAGVGLARLLDLQALVLSPSDQLLTLLGERLSLLEVQPATQSRLLVTGTLPAQLDVGALRAALPMIAVEWIAGDEDGIRLELSEDAILELALRNYHAPLKTGRLPLRDPQTRPERPAAMTPSELATLDRGVLRPLMAAQRGNPEWSKLAAWHARRLGLELMEDEETYSLATSPLNAPPQWALWLRKGGGEGAFEVPTAGRHYRTLRVGRSWWEATQAGALLVHNARADTDTFQLQRDGVFSPEALILRRLALDKPGLNVVSVSAFMQYENPGVDALLSSGRPLLQGQEESEALTALRTLVARGGGNSGVYSARPTELRFHDSRNARRRAVELAGGDYLTAYLSPTFRLAFGPLTDSPSLRSALATAEIPLEDAVFLEEWEAQGIESAETEALFGPLLEALHRYGRLGHPGELSRIRSLGRRMGLRLSIWTESEEGLPYLHARRGKTHLLAPLCNFNGQRGADTLTGLRKDGKALVWRAP